MNTALAIAALVAACNAPRRRVALSTDDTTAVALGAALTVALLVALSAVADPLFDALDVSAPNLRIGVGFVLAVVSAHDIVRRPPPSGAALAGRNAAFVPVFFPVLARPEVALLAMAIGMDHGIALTAFAAVLALATVVVWHRVATNRRVTTNSQTDAVFARVERGLGIVIAAAAAALAVAIIADGVFAI
jgi:hypothetical protein